MTLIFTFLYIYSPTSVFNGSIRFIDLTIDHDIAIRLRSNPAPTVKGVYAFYELCCVYMYNIICICMYNCICKRVYVDLCFFQDYSSII